MVPEHPGGDHHVGRVDQRVRGAADSRHEQHGLVTTGCFGPGADPVGTGTAGAIPSRRRRGHRGGPGPPRGGVRSLAAVAPRVRWRAVTESSTESDREDRLMIETTMTAEARRRREI